MEIGCHAAADGAGPGRETAAQRRRLVADATHHNQNQENRLRPRPGQARDRNSRDQTTERRNECQNESQPGDQSRGQTGQAGRQAGTGTNWVGNRESVRRSVLERLACVRTLFVAKSD